MNVELNLLVAIDNKDQLFSILEDVLDTEKRKRTFIEIKPGLSQSEIAKRADVNQSVFSRVISKLKEFGLVEETQEGGYKKTISCMNHPLMKKLWKQEVLEDD